MLPVHNISELQAQVPSSCTDNPNSKQSGAPVLTTAAKGPLATLHGNKLLVPPKRVTIALVPDSPSWLRPAERPDNPLTTAPNGPTGRQRRGSRAGLRTQEAAGPARSAPRPASPQRLPAPARRPLPAPRRREPRPSAWGCPRGPP